MTNTDIVKKLIGKINPIGETNTDNDRFENLKDMCDLVHNLIIAIDEVRYERNSHEYSVKRAGDFAENFIVNTLSIKQ